MLQQLFDIVRRLYNEEDLANIILGVQHYYTTRYSEFKNDLKEWLEKQGETWGSLNISVENWSKYIEYS